MTQYCNNYKILNLCRTGNGLHAVAIALKESALALKNTDTLRFHVVARGCKFQAWENARTVSWLSYFINQKKPLC